MTIVPLWGNLSISGLFAVGFGKSIFAEARDTPWRPLNKQAVSHPFEHAPSRASGIGFHTPLNLSAVEPSVLKYTALRLGEHDRPFLMICQFEQNISMTRLTYLAPTGEVFAAQRRYLRQCRANDAAVHPFGVSLFCFRGCWNAVVTYTKRISPDCWPRDAHRVRRQPPSLSPLQLHALRHDRAFLTNDPATVAAAPVNADAIVVNDAATSAELAAETEPAAEVACDHRAAFSSS
jgi:hypothetical protein